MCLAHRFLDDLCPVPNDEEPDDGRDDDHVEWPEIVTWHKCQVWGCISERLYTAPPPTSIYISTKGRWNLNIVQKKSEIFANSFAQMFTFAK